MQYDLAKYQMRSLHVVAGFPFVKRTDEYNYDFQQSVNKAQIQDLCSLRFIDKKENILFYGTPGVGKTHLATSIGIEAASKIHMPSDTLSVVCVLNMD